MVRAVVLVLVAGCGRLGFDAPSDADAPGADAPAVGCSTAGADTVALYTFDDATDPYADAGGDHDGTLAVAGTTTPAPPCGAALMLDAGSYLKVADAPDLDLATGSLELRVWMQTTASGHLQAVLGRDANGTDFDGHLTVALAPAGNVWVRLQRTGDVMAYRCSDPIPAQTWIHLGISFGGDDSQGFRLWIDHVQPTTTSYFDGDVTHDCTQVHGFGIAGNDNTLVIGATDWTDANADPAPVCSLFPDHGTLIDEVHLRSTWRDFSAP